MMVPGGADPYSALATSQAPALIIYVLDISASMTRPLGGQRRIDVVTEALVVALRRMVFLSTKGALIAPRYRVAMFAYSDHVYDLIPGIAPIDQLIARGVPELEPQQSTDTAQAFARVEQLLLQELPALHDGPAPLICHLTDGEYTGADPEPIARRITDLRVPDGNVLLENIFLSEDILPEPVIDPRQWPGVTARTPLEGDYAAKLRALSSPLPQSYRAMLDESGYHFAPDAVMLLPGVTPELVELGFVMSTATPITR